MAPDLRRVLELQFCQPAWPTCETDSGGAAGPARGERRLPVDRLVGVDERSSNSPPIWFAERHLAQGRFLNLSDPFTSESQTTADVGQRVTLAVQESVP